MKKGISSVVATVLIILITVAAVTIIWSAVIPMIKDNLTGSDDCMKAQADISIGTSGYTCINRTTGAISLQVVRGPGEFVLDSIQVLVHVSGNTYTETVSNLPSANNEKVVSIPANSNYANADKVEIAPVIKVGNTKKNCGISQSYTLMNCTA